MTRFPLVRGLAFDWPASVAAAATLAAGITACVTVFSVADTSLLRELPFPRPERLVVVHDQLRKLNISDMPVAWRHYEDYRNQPHLFEESAAFAPHEFTLNLATGSERVPALRISAEMLPMLGVQPLLGRNIRAEECRAGKDRVVLLGYQMWLQRFGARKEAVGQTLRLDGQTYQIAGVLPPRFALRAGSGPKPALYAPVPFDFDPAPKPPHIRILARLKQGVEAEQAAAQMATVAQRLLPDHQLYGGPRGSAMGYAIAVTPLRDRLFGTLRRPAYLLSAAVALVLLIACVNVANLLLVRVQRRARDYAVRQALGCGQARLVAGVLLESLAISSAAGLAGTLAAHWCLRLLVYAGPPEIAGITFDWRPAAFAVLVSIASGAGAALLPAIRIMRANLAPQIAGTRTATAGRSRRKMMQTLVAVETALSVVLLTGAALLLRSFHSLRTTELGFERERVVTGVVTLPQLRYRTVEQTRAFWARLRQTLGESREAEIMTISSGLPLMMPSGGAPFVIEGRPFSETSVAKQSAHSLAVDSEFFKAFGIPVIAGRAVDERDGVETPRVGVINETLARRFFPNENPIGKRLLIGGPRPNAPWLTIIGIVRDVRLAGPAHPPLPQIYTSAVQWPSPYCFVTLRTRTDTQQAQALLARSVASLDAEAALSDVRTMEERFSASTARSRFQTGLLTAFAAIALLLSMAGIGAVVAYTVAQRTGEIGVRLAIGATTGDVFRLVIRDGMKPVLAGLGAGFIGAAWAADWLGSLLFETRPLDPLAFGGSLAAFTGIALLSCAAAARRAVSVDPLQVLKSE